MKSVIGLTKAELLARTKEFYFSLGVQDGASSLCKANFRYGLAKLHYTQESLGLTPNATFISTPDETITKNRARWLAGYGYGGKLTWTDKNDPFIIIDAKPNACGMLVGGLDEMPQPEDIIKNINRVINEDNYIDDVKIEWDFKKGNHFIDVFKTKAREEGSQLPRYSFIIHGSVPELRKETEKGPGLYYDASKALFDMCEKVDTPFGPTYYLEGDNAKEYLQFFQYAKKFAAQKREKAAELLFGKFKVLSNPLHQGLISYGDMLLGCQHITEDPNKIFPVALRSDLPAYLIKALPNLTSQQIGELGFENRAKKWDLMHRLENFNTFPHGGGYALPHISRVTEVKVIDGERYFICEQENQDGLAILEDIRETQFLYRGKVVMNKIDTTSLGKVVAQLNPKFILKI